MHNVIVYFARHFSMERSHVEKKDRKYIWDLEQLQEHHEVLVLES